MRVLIVDDNRTNLRILTLMVTRFGAEAVTAANGREALELLETERFDLVFMDLAMPVMDGYEAVERLHRLGRANAPPVYAVSANVTDSVMARVASLDFAGFIPKPVRTDAIREKLALA